MIARLLRKLLTAEMMGLTLVLLALGTMTYGISSSLRGVDRSSLLQVCIVAALISLGLSKTHLKGITASLVMTVLGIASVWAMGAGLARPLLDLLRSLVAMGPQIIPEIGYRFDVDGSQLVESWRTILSASTALSIRWRTWFIGIRAETAVSDPFIRNLIWVLAFWFLAAWIGWFTGKRRAITALLPAIMVMAEVTSYSEYRIGSLWFMVFIMLLLMGVWNYRNSTAQWERHKVDYSESIVYDTSQAVVLLSIAIGLLAFITPSVSWREVRDYLREHDRQKKDGNTAQILGIREQPVKTKNVYVQTPSLPREHLLTGGFAQSEKVVMTIRTGELAPVAIPDITTNAPRYYWHSVVYDEYMGAGWVTSSAPPQEYKANTPLIAGLLDGYRPLHLDVQIQEPDGQLYWAGLLYSADVPFRGDWRIRPQANLFADQTELLQADIFRAASTATSYTAQAYVPDVTIQELREASTEYPEAIRQRYLQLPSTLPDRVAQLSAQVVEGKTNPYEKAKAIEAYLRSNYVYDLKVPVPPEDQDVADYFLFELKRGYCDYYATAMVVMLRSVGVPARFVSGYSSGSYDAQAAQYIVRELNAHSWVEVYFPQIGWVEFEPTSSEPEIDRPEKKPDLSTIENKPTPASRFLFRLTNTDLLYWISPLVIVLFLILLYYAILERMIFLSMKPLAAIEILYQRYYRIGRALTGASTRAETAYEFTNKLIHNVEDLYRDSRNQKLPARVRMDSEQFTGLYQTSLFSDHTINKQHTGIAFRLWRRLHRHITIAKIKNVLLINSHRFKNFFARFLLRSRKPINVS